MENVIIVNGVEYVKKDSLKKLELTENYVIIRTYSAGVFAGYLKSRKGKEVILNDARRIWNWSGAASLSELAMKGTNAPENCKFPCPVTEVILTEAIEVIPCTKIAKESIQSVKEWSAHE